MYLKNNYKRLKMIEINVFLKNLKKLLFGVRRQPGIKSQGLLTSRVDQIDPVFCQNDEIFRIDPD